jgi:hypothetical protein
MAVVADYYDGNTHVIIKDDCIVSPEDQQKILKRCGEIAARQYREATDRHRCPSASRPSDTAVNRFDADVDDG